MATKHQSEGDAGVATETSTREQLKKPQLFKVIFHNDNYTSMEFVVFILQSIFHKSESDATLVMLSIHRTGLGVAGVYAREIAETKVNQTHQLAREAEYPLKLSIEPEEL